MRYGGRTNICTHNKIVPLYTLVWGSLRLAPNNQNFEGHDTECQGRANVGSCKYYIHTYIHTYMHAVGTLIHSLILCQNLIFQTDNYASLPLLSRDSFPIIVPATMVFVAC